MAIDRQATGLAIIRVCIGTFFLAEGVSKYRWFSDSSMLAGQLSGWAQNAAPGSFSARYLEHVALPWAVYFARLVPLGEMKYRYLRWKINRVRKKFDVYSGGRADDFDRRIH